MDLVARWRALCEQFPWWTALAILLLALALCALTFPVVRRDSRPPGSVLLGVAVLVFAMPWLYPLRPVVPKVVVTLMCSAVLVPKLIDSMMFADAWRRRGWLAWIASLLNPGTILHRPDWTYPSPTTMQNLRMLGRGFVEVLAGAMLLRWAMARDLGAISFWLDHGVKLAAAYLIAFDGGITLLCGLARLMGMRVIDFSRHPILASTPADFWRRYNREAGRFLYEVAFKPLGGLRHPRRAIFATFILNGLLHEYLAWLMVGSIQGYQIAYFILHGAATAWTWHLRPRGVGRMIGIVLTIAFGFFTSVLFFASVDNFMQWYSRGSILP